MRQPGSLRQFGIYLLLQIPGYVLAGLLLGLLVERDWLSVGWAILALLGWVGKDLALYPAMRRVFQPSRVGSAHRQRALARRAPPARRAPARRDAGRRPRHPGPHRLRRALPSRLRLNPLGFTG
jgi:hypothetical protein